MPEKDSLLVGGMLQLVVIGQGSYKVAEPLLDVGEKSVEHHPVLSCQLDAIQLDTIALTKELTLEGRVGHVRFIPYPSGIGQAP